MGKYSFVSESIPNIPWEDKPKDFKSKTCVWRYSGNPVIKRDLLPYSNSIFNSAVVPYNGEFRGVFRCDDIRREMLIHSGKSKDGLNWDINPKPIKFTKIDPELEDFEYGYDPRVIKIDDKYYVTWCNGYHGYTIGMAYTEDFETFYQMENAFLPWNRNGVLFPRKINGNFAMISRPSDTGHTPFGDIFYSESPDATFWGKHRFVMKPTRGWQGTKIGPGPVPIETSEGWLMIYHGVLNSCNGFVYSYGAALLDLDQPWKVIARTEPYMMSPQRDYECVGDVPNVTFPCACLVDQDTGKMAIYYGAADTVTGLAFSYVDDMVDFVKENSIGVFKY
jgi:beta-1,4-mannooligosaccharide/beta-1,4-mannosyl-N-acetylglucosamine phosphorylase